MGEFSIEGSRKKMSGGVLISPSCGASSFHGLRRDRKRHLNGERNYRTEGETSNPRAPHREREYIEAKV